MKTLFLLKYLIYSLLIITTPSLFAKTITKKGYLASPSAEVLVTATSYLINGNEKALDEFSSQRELYTLDAGIEVSIIERKTNKGLVKIKPKGKDIELWTVIEALEEK